MKTIYFAGPDVFMPGYDQHLVRVKKMCSEVELRPLLPADPELSEGAEDPGSEEIFAANLELIRRADGIIAHLCPFRGLVEPDSGTVFECGYGYSLGKFIIGIVPDQRDLVTRLGAADSPPLPGGGRSLPDGSWVEDYGHPVNLMLAHCFSSMVSSLEEAIGEVCRMAGN